MSASGGCGCGGSSAVAVKGAGDCSCGCDVLTTGAGFVRPRFFGGMLLTEDDLQAAIDYTVAKRRLTNRNVIGAGVVCGLQVACNPCDAGKVDVSPGYAIECCGNDILVSCKEEVDVLALARDLRVRTGMDCGEGSDQNARRDYYLYVRYAELPTEPVAPYAPDDCATGECEFSRVREGYCFELRCNPADTALTLVDALKNCRPGDARAADDKTMTDVLRLAAGSAVVPEQPAPAPAAPPVEIGPPPSIEDLDSYLDNSESRLDPGLSLLQRATHALMQDNPPGTGMSPGYREQLMPRVLNLSEFLRKSSELAALAPAERDRIMRFLDDARDHPESAVLDTSVPEQDLEDDPKAHADDATRAFVTGAERIRNVILGRITGDGQTACDEYRTVGALRFDGLTDAAKQDAVKLGRSYLRMVAACSCDALHPPCPTCTDDAVALAKVRVENCKVVDVCSLERSWVASPRGLSYWFGIVEMLRKSMEPACCGELPLGRNEHEPPDAFGDLLGDAWTTFTEATTAPPEVRTELLLALDKVSPPPAEKPAIAAPHIPTMRELQARVDELAKQVADLAAAAGKKAP